MSLSTRRLGLSCLNWSGCLKTYEWVHHILDDRLDSLWSAQVHPDRPLLRLEDQSKREKGAASSLDGDELHKPVRPSGTSSVKNSVSCSMSLNAFLSDYNVHSSGSVFQFPGTNRHVETVLHRSQGTYPTVVVSARRIVSVVEIKHDTFKILDARHG